MVDPYVVFGYVVLGYLLSFTESYDVFLFAGNEIKIVTLLKWEKKNIFIQLVLLMIISISSVIVRLV